MKNLVLDNKEIGEYLRKHILKKYGTVRSFCRAFLTLKGETPDEMTITTLANRFSSILNGRTGIQVFDILYLTELLKVSCEEILTAGKKHVPISGRVTNYTLAASQDPAEWEEYMKREDRLFLNFDEYGKSVIDYALEFRNYKFIKYLIDNRFIWFVDLSSRINLGFTYGAGTSVKERILGKFDSALPIELLEKDELRTSTIALAIENKDNAVLDTLLARQIPAMHMAGIMGYPQIDLKAIRNDALIEAVANADEKVIAYFSEEFPVKDVHGKENTFIYPYLGEVIAALLKNGRYSEAEAVITRAIRHNQNAYAKLTDMVEKACANDYELKLILAGNISKAEAVSSALRYGFRYEPGTGFLSFFYAPEKRKYEYLITNIVSAENGADSNKRIRALLEKLKDSYQTILDYGKGEM